MVTSILYNKAICTSNTELLMNSAVLLFLNDLDEKIYSALEKMFPLWLEMLDAEIFEKSRLLEAEIDERETRFEIEIDRRQSRFEDDIKHRLSTFMKSLEEKINSSINLPNLKFSMKSIKFPEFNLHNSLIII